MISSGRSRAAVASAAGMPLLLAFPEVRHILESRMVLHMMLEWPLLLAAGWAANKPSRKASVVGRRYDQLDVHGLLGMTLLTGFSLFWMLPVSLDLSLLSVPMCLFKYTGWWLCGLALRRSWPRLADESLVFFLGSMAWMLATAGLLYQASESRLCVNYLIDDQMIAGRALVIAAVLLGGLAAIRLARPRSEGANRPRHQV